jgi:hypothetical protein
MAVVLDWGHSAISGDVFDFHDLRMGVGVHTGSSGQRLGIVLSILNAHPGHPHIKDLCNPKVNSATVETPALWGKIVCVSR